MSQPYRISKLKGFLIIFPILLGLVLAISTYGQEASDINPEPEASRDVSPVKIDGKVLFYVKGIKSFPSEERADAIARRIDRVASDPLIPVDSVKILATEGQLKIYAGKEHIMIITSADAIQEGINQTVLANWIVKKIKDAIISYRDLRSSPVVVRSMFHALGAVLLFSVCLFVFLWLIKRLNRRLENRIKTKVTSLESKSFNIIQSAHLWKAISMVFRTLKIVVIVIITAVFLQYTLGLFPLTMGIASYTLSLFMDPLIAMGKGFISFLPSLAFLFIIYLVTRYLLKLIKLFFTSIHEGGIKLVKFENEMALPTYKILRLVIIVFALVIAYPYIPGSETSAFKGISVFLGVLLSLGSSSFISNIIAGYSMTYRAAFKIGDLIQVDDQIGFVEEQRLLVTRLRSRKNEEISIPNSELLSNNIMNYSKRAKDLGLILHTSVGIGYETPWRLVETMLKLAAARTEGLLKEPPPFVLKQSLDTFAITYHINAYCDDPSNMYNYYNLLHQNILDVFNENNVQIMTPAYEGDPEKPKVVPQDEWNKPLAIEP
jgi:small-conductance mechanosensitive channel